MRLGTTFFALSATVVLGCGPATEASEPVAGSGSAQAERQRVEPLPGLEPLPPTDPGPASALTPVPVPEVVSRCEIPDATERPVRSLVYSRPSGVRLRLDLAVPDGDGPHPVVLLFHGGGWSAGERVHLRDEILALASIGYAAASADYRLFHDRQNLFPAQVADARCAVRFLRRNAAELGLDADRICAGGFSAGGHLALMLATAADVQGLDAGCEDTTTSPRIRSAIGFFAPSDLRAEAPYGTAADRIITSFLGASRRERPELAALASPIVHLDEGDAAVLLAHAVDDSVVPVGQSRRMRAALEQVGVPVQSVEVEGTTHGFRLLSRREHHRRSTCTSLAFIDSTIGDR